MVLPLVLLAQRMNMVLPLVLLAQRINMMVLLRGLLNVVILLVVLLLVLVLLRNLNHMMVVAKLVLEGHKQSFALFHNRMQHLISN